MRSDKGKAFVLRRSGKSYAEITRELGVAKSTLSNWFTGVDFSQAIKQELTKQATKQNRARLQQLNRVRGIALCVHYEQAEREALKELDMYRHLPLFTTAVTAYWGEGDKASKNYVRITNTDPKFLNLFVIFLEKLCGIEKSNMRLALFIYPDVSETKAQRYWRQTLGVKQFHKTQIVPSRHKTKKLPYGTCTVIVSNSYLKKKMLVWIDHLPEIVLNTVPQIKKRP